MRPVRLNSFLVPAPEGDNNIVYVEDYSILFSKGARFIYKSGLVEVPQRIRDITPP